MFRRIGQNPVKAPMAPAPQAPVRTSLFGRTQAPAVAPAVAPATQPNLSTAVGQLKAGDQFGAQNTMRQTVGLPTFTPPPANENPQLSDAIGRLKMGDRASAEAMMRKMVGLKKGGKLSGPKKSSKTSSASKRADGIVSKGKTKGRMI